MKFIAPDCFKETDILNKIKVLGVHAKHSDLCGKEVVKVADIYDFTPTNLHYKFLCNTMDYRSPLLASLSSDQSKIVGKYTFEECNIGQLFYSVSEHALYYSPYLLRDLSLEKGFEVCSAMKKSVMFTVRYFYIAGLVFYKESEEDSVRYKLVSYVNEDPVGVTKNRSICHSPISRYAFYNKLNQKYQDSVLFQLETKPKSVICLDSDLNLYEFPKVMYKHVSDCYQTAERFLGVKNND